MQQLSSDQVQVSQREERKDLGGVFDDAPVTHLAVAEDAFYHVIRMFALGPGFILSVILRGVPFA